MNMMSGDDLLLPASSNKKCEKFRKPIAGKAYNFSATGDKATNNMYRIHQMCSRISNSESTNF